MTVNRPCLSYRKEDFTAKKILPKEDSTQRMQFTRNFDKKVSYVEAQLHKNCRRYQRKREAVPRIPIPSLPRLEPEIVCEKRKKYILCTYKGKHHIDMAQTIRE